MIKVYHSFNKRILLRQYSNKKYTKNNRGILIFEYNYLIKEKISIVSNNIKDELFKNSFFQLATTMFNNGIGFLFWLIATRYYSVEEVGIATVLMSSLNIILILSTLGLDYSLIRYINTKEKSKILSTCFIVTSTVSLTIGSVFILTAKYISSSISFLQSPIYAAIFLITVLIGSLFFITGIAFKALRKSNFFLLQYIFSSLKIALLVPLVFLGGWGIYISSQLACLAAVLFAYKRFKEYLSVEIDISFLKDAFNFSLHNYLSRNLYEAPTLILPILILNLLGEKDAALFNIAFLIGNFVLIIPTAICTALFVEGSYGENLKTNIIKSVIFIGVLLIPAISFLNIYSEFLLNIFGAQYSKASFLLELISISSIFVSIHLVYIAIQNIKMKSQVILHINLIRFVLLGSLGYIMIGKMGIIGIGYAWLVTHVLINILIIYLVKKRDIYNKKRWKAFTKCYHE
ncbi:MAG: oligosaccharide flippase family protein [Methanosarcina flavescens]